MKLNKFDIKPYEFKHPIEIQRLTPGVDEDNIPIEDNWNTLFKTRAKVLNVRGDEYFKAQEYFEAQEVGMRIEKTFYIRTRRNNPVTNLDRVIYKDIAYDIEYANDIEEAGIITEIKVKLVK